MKVSVVVPVFNKEPWLKACLESIFGQGYPHFEVVVVDDRSTDGSLELLRGWKDDRLRVEALSTNVGPAGAAQRAMDLATGEYIVRMDADDVMLPDRIAKQLAFMDAHPEVGFSGGHQQVIGTSELMHASLNDEDCRAGQFFRIPVFQPTSIYRRSVLLQHGIRFMDEWPRYGEDRLFQARLLKVTHCANLNEALVAYRVGPQNQRAEQERSSALRRLLEALFAEHRWPLDEVSLQAHFTFLHWFPHGLDATTVRAAKQHLSHLRRLNRELETFPKEAFERALGRAWNDLGFRVPAFGWAPVLAYWLHDGTPNWRKWRYMLAARLSGRA